MKVKSNKITKVIYKNEKKKNVCMCVFMREHPRVREEERNGIYVLFHAEQKRESS